MCFFRVFDVFLVGGKWRSSTWFLLTSGDFLVLFWWFSRGSSVFFLRFFVFFFFFRVLFFWRLFVLGLTKVPFGEYLLLFFLVFLSKSKWF